MLLLIDCDSFFHSIDQTKNYASIGFPWTNGTESNITKDKNGHLFNCFINEHLDRYWIPKFHKALDSYNH